MKVLLSIKPEFAEKILNGTKRFEFRKGIFKNPQISTVVIYATMPLGKVVGQFRIESILSDEPESLWKRRKNTQVFLSNFMTHIIQVEKRPTQ